MLGNLELARQTPGCTPPHSSIAVRHDTVIASQTVLCLMVHVHNIVGSECATRGVRTLGSNLSKLQR